MTEAERSRRDTVTWLTRALFVAVAARAFVPDALEYLLRGRPPDLTTFVVTRSGRHPLASRAALLSDLIVLAVGAALVVRAFRDGRGRVGRNPLLVALAGLWAVSAVATYAAGGSPRIASLAMGVALMGLVAAPPTRDEGLFLGAWLVLALAGVSVVVALVRPDVALVSSADGRIYLWQGERLAGLLSHPNALGYAMAMGLPFVLFAWRGAARVAAAGLVLVSLVATASRTSLVASAVTGVLLFALARGTEPVAPPTATSKATMKAVATDARRLVVVVTVAAVLAISVQPLLGVRPPLVRSSGRFALWAYVRASWDSDPVLGRGAAAWDNLAREASGFIEFAFHAHNLWLETLFATGLVGITALSAMALLWWYAVMTGIRQRDALGALAFFVFFLSATTEVPTYFLSWDSRALILVLALTVSWRSSAGRARSLASRGTPQVPRRMPTRALSARSSVRVRG